jgi:hypothetical protein
MKRILILTAALALSALAQTPPANPAPAQPTAQRAPIPETPNSRKAREVLDRMIQALGGDAYLTFQDMEQVGRTYRFYRGVPVGTGARYWRFWKWPDKDRIELTKQRDVIYVRNGDTGWEITYKGTRLEDPHDLAEYLRIRHYSLEQVIRRWLCEPGVALFYEGGGIIEQKPVEKVTIMNAQNEAATLHIHANSFLPVKKIYSLRDPKTREINEEAEVYDNWRPLQGIQTAHSYTRFYNGEMAGQRFIESVKYNVGLPDSMFTATVTYDPTKKTSR